MAYPVIQTSAYTEVSASNETTIDATVPSGTVENDLLVAFHTTDGSETHTATGWTQIGSTVTDGTSTLSAWWRIAPVTPPATYTFTSGSVERHIVTMFRITGHDTTTPIEANGPASNSGSSVTPICSGYTAGSSQDYLVFYPFGSDRGRVGTEDTGYPTSTTGHYVRNSDTSSAACSHGVATLDFTGTAIPSADWTDILTTGDGWAAMTVAIQPGAAAAAEFVCDVDAVATTASALTTSIEAAASVSSSATTASALTTDITAAGAISGSATTTAALTTELKFAAVVSGDATVSAALTAPIQSLFAATISANATTAAALTIPEGTARLSQLAVETLSGGAPSAKLTQLAIELIIDNAPVPITAAIDISATVAGALTTSIPLASDISTSGSVSAALTSSIIAKASLSATAISQGTLTTAITLAATCNGVANASATLLVESVIAAAISANATAVGALTNSITLASAINAGVTVSPLLTAGATLSAVITCESTSSAALTTEITLAATSDAAANTSAALLTAISLAAAVNSTVIVSSALTSAISLAGDITALANTVAALTVPTGTARLSQLAVETIASGVSKARLTQLAVEILVSNPLDTLAGILNVSSAVAGALTTELPPVVVPTVWGMPIAGPWDFVEQPNKWGYLNNPRWTDEPGAPVSYNGNEEDEPQVWELPGDGFSAGDSIKHTPCGHWHKKSLKAATDIVSIFGTYQGHVTDDFVVALSFDLASETLTYKGYYQSDPDVNLQAIDLHNESESVVVIEGINETAQLLLVSQHTVKRRPEDEPLLGITGRIDTLSQYDVTLTRESMIIHNASNYYILTDAYRLLKLGLDLEEQLTGYTGLVSRSPLDNALYVLSYIPIISDPWDSPPDGGSNVFWEYIPDQQTDSFIYPWPQAFGYTARGFVKMFMYRNELFVHGYASPFDESSKFNLDTLEMNSYHRSGNSGQTLAVQAPYAYNVDGGIISWVMYQMDLDTYTPTGKSLPGLGDEVDAGAGMLYEGYFLCTHSGGIYSIDQILFDEFADEYVGADSKDAIIPLRNGYFATAGSDDIYVYFINPDGTIRLVDSVALSNFGPRGKECRGLTARID